MTSSAEPPTPGKIGIEAFSVDRADRNPIRLITISLPCRVKR